VPTVNRARDTDLDVAMQSCPPRRPPRGRHVGSWRPRTDVTARRPRS